MLTGRRVLFGYVPFVAPKAQGMVSSPHLAFFASPRLPLFLTFFR
jgi:hypothetical protein